MNKGWWAAIIAVLIVIFLIAVYPKINLSPSPVPVSSAIGLPGALRADVLAGGNSETRTKLNDYLGQAVEAGKYEEALRYAPPGSREAFVGNLQGKTLTTTEGKVLNLPNVREFQCDGKVRGIGVLVGNNLVLEKQPDCIKDPEKFVAGEVLVKVRGDVSDEKKNSMLKKIGAIGALKGIGDSNIQLVSVSGDVLKVVETLREDPDVEFAEPNGLLEKAVIPNDQFYMQDQQELFNLLSVPSGWDITRGSPNVISAVLDSGVKKEHEDMVNKMAPSWNIILNNDDVVDCDGHGTQTTSIIGGDTNNSRGVASINWAGKAMHVKISTSSTVLANLNVSTDLAVGDTIDWGDYFNGNIDDVQVYSRVLNANEVSTLYNSSIGLDNNGDLLLWLGMDNIDASGNPLDSSTWSNNGVKFGNAAQTPDGKFGKAFSFDGAGGYIRVPKSASFDKPSQSGQVTFSLWLKPVSVTVFKGVIGNDAVRLVQLSDRRIGLYLWDGTTYKVVTSFPISGLLKANEWQHVVATYDKATKKVVFYLNGVMAGGSDYHCSSTGAIGDMVNGIAWAGSHGAKIVSISYAGVAVSSAIMSAAQSFMNNYGGLVFAAAGNMGQFIPYADSPYLMVIGATLINETGQGGEKRALWSTYGNNLDMMGYGLAYTAYHEGGWACNNDSGDCYQWMLGTSGSSPMVASAAALVYALNNSFNGPQVEYFLEQGADKIGNAQGWSNQTGWGRLNVTRSLELARIGYSAPCTRRVPIVSITPVTQWGNPGQKLSYVLTITSNDSQACTDAVFTSLTTKPTGFARAPTSISVTLSPGMSANIVLNITSPTTAQLGVSYQFNETVTNGADTTKRTVASGYYNVYGTSQCSDGSDNDNDGAKDYLADFSCSDMADNDETNPKSQCQDGIDNDRDGKIDYPLDGGCTSLQDNDEMNQPGTATDDAGAQNATSANRTIGTIDTAPPSITIIKPLNGASFNRTQDIAIEASATDVSGVASITILIDNGAMQTICYADRCSFDWTGASVGPHTITAKAIDNSLRANSAQKSVSISVV